MNSMMGMEAITLCVKGVPIARGYMTQMEQRAGMYEEDFGMARMVRPSRITAHLELEPIDWEQEYIHRKTNPTSLDPSGFAW